MNFSVFSNFKVAPKIAFHSIILSIVKVSILKLVIISIVLILGIYFRFSGFDRPIYTVDEVRGIMRAVGSSEQSFVEAVYDNKIVSNSKIKAHQYLGSEETLKDTINSLIRNPEHPPLYYFLVRLSMQVVNHPSTGRLLSIAFGLLCLPAIYWLSLELFELPSAGYQSAIVTAIIPLQIWLSQEARQYTLWAFLTLVSSAALVRATKKENKYAWWIYGISIIAGIYTHLFFAWVVLAHILYILIARFSSKKIITHFMVSILACVAASLPWAFIILTRLDRLRETTKWVASGNYSLVSIVSKWLENLAYAFIHFDWKIYAFNPISIILMVLILCGIYSIFRNFHRSISIFIVLSILIPSLGQILPDALLGGRRSTLLRYLLPSYLAIQVVLAYLSALWISNLRNTLFKKSKMRKLSYSAILGLFMLATIFIGSLSSSARMSQLQGWNKGPSVLNVGVARVVNKFDRPLIISDAPYMYVLALSHLVSDETKWYLTTGAESQLDCGQEDTLPTWTEMSNYSTFIYLSTPDLVDSVQACYGEKPKLLLGPTTWFKTRNNLYYFEDG